MQGKKIILGVTASIAAYKSALLVRLLVKKGAEVKVLMSQTATEFITPLTLATLSKNPVFVDFVKDKTGVWHNHVDLGLWADAIVVAPASANTIAKCANGICDNLLTATYFSARSPVFFAPAMDLDMYKHPATQENLRRLQSYGNFIIPSEYGELASGLIGEGRMAEPEHIVDFLQNFFQEKQIFAGKKVMITAGATREAIDPVRFISNYSTGKMGFALAESFARKGAEVHLIAANTSIAQPENVSSYKVSSAQEMFETAQSLVSEMDICVFSAAVADYRPKEVATEKIKKNTETLTLELIKNVDIAFTLGQKKKKNQFFVGFALETQNETENALQKLQKKNFDMVVLNSLKDEGAGFAHDTNKISIIDKNGTKIDFPLKSKKEVAKDIVSFIYECLQK
ncbi:bifunctional phosphopantothenoylcysteine decarboxylase/phosphopantothenate--cysteine ligase CoaBC [Raineya orbicola]|jgi:phosphopantothenoylcysteine decarboxylase/phosphopantothenate--cysteine ligase|uniref:Coenzyme A biosynthesis bifunctional protein CoaBC n=1 Tax=Raineya orbicola TaxID=2016530 RepID=A0A2N3II90_9BACT|nr:bifunctional phosphopantothenoylcysteine decarboxylase/phosphopantothenate--cysteine ligase CoaBC [Raineya orbicola]PKQ69943.1 Phosphopantothenoylcysteine decarboxylase / phosphopantothenate--cysteine ligase [Raineya orbicola]